MALTRPPPRSDADIIDFIRANLRLAGVPGHPDIHLHLAHPGSGLHRLGDGELDTPYWAYVWGGGLALTAHLYAHPETVAGGRVLDLGAGSGLVAIAAVRAGAAKVWASEVDPHGRIVLPLNASANGAKITLLDGDLLDEGPPPVGVILVGDLFYAPDLSRRVTAFLDRAVAKGVEVLVGDPGRADLPRDHLQTVAEYPVTDFGGSPAAGIVARFVRKP
ncbi:methyltransferase [soil metagenome]